MILCLVLVKIGAPVVAYWKRVRHVQKHVANSAGWHGLRGSIPSMEPGCKAYYLSLVARFPRMFVFWFGPILPIVSLTHPEALADAMRCGPGKLEFVYSFFKKYLGNGLVTSSGKRWSRDRRLLSHVFTPKMLREYVPVFKEACATMLDQWSAAAQQKKSLDVGKCMPLLTFDVILKCAMGVNTDCQTNTDMSSRHIRYLKAVEDVVSITMLRMRQPWTWWDFLYYRGAAGKHYAGLVREVHQYSEELIAQRRQEIEMEQARCGNDDSFQYRCKDMLDMMLTVRDEDGYGMTDMEIREQVDTFLLAGRDTGSSAMQWAVDYFAKHPDIQEKCRAEVRQVMESCGGIDGFEHEHISQLQYLTQFVQEVLRDAGVVPHVSRTLKKDTLVDGVLIPAQAQVQMNMLGIHHNAEVWDDPHVFNPDRFAPGKKRHPYAFIPFAVGARNCLGKHFVLDEIRVVLAMILMNFVLLPDPDAETPYWKTGAASRPFPTLFIKLEETHVTPDS